MSRVERGCSLVQEGEERRRVKVAMIEERG